MNERRARRIRSSPFLPFITKNQHSQFSPHFQKKIKVESNYFIFVTTHHHKTIKFQYPMFKPTRPCLSALSKRTKRVKVQILKDFPTLQYLRGQVVEVKPSLMRNYLHNYNGAKYILKDADVDTVLLKEYTARREQLDLEMAAAREQVESKQSKAVGLQQQQQVKEKEKKRSHVLDSDVSIKDVVIPGLDIWINRREEKKKSEGLPANWETIFFFVHVYKHT